MRRVLACIGIAAAACLAAAPAASAAPTGEEIEQQVGQAKISEIATFGQVGPMGQAQIIEIGNASRTAPVDLSGYYIQIYSAHNTVLQTIQLPEHAVLQPFGSAPEEVFWTISSPAFTGAVLVDQPGALMAAIPRTGGVALFNPFGQRVDAVAFSPTATAALEGLPAPVPTLPAELEQLNPSIARDLLLRDTNVNRNDFRLQFASPEEYN